MTAIPQPRLYLRIYGDGLGEFETDAPTGERGYGAAGLIKKQFRVSQDDIQEILTLGRELDLLSAKESYPAYRRWDDSSLETTVIFSIDGYSKKIVLNNFDAWNTDNKQHYPLSLIHLMRLSSKLWKGAMGIVDRIDSINFDDVFKYPEQFLDRPIKIYATVEIADDGTPFLKGPETPGVPKLPDNGEIRFADEGVKLKKQIAELAGDRLGGRARVLALGTLKDDPRRSEGPARYVLDIDGFETMEPIVLPYEGILDRGWTYSDTFDHVKGTPVTLSSTIKVLHHHAARIEWLNATKFPRLNQAGLRYMTFRVISHTQQMQGPARWNDVYTCLIMDVK